MRRFLTLLAFLVGSVAVSAYEPQIRDINVSLLLRKDGTALVTERWDVTVASGTEWYLVRENLGDIQVGNLSVNDESGVFYTNEGDWDVDRSLEKKARKCGIVQKHNGVEICWGVGSYGPHSYTVSYTMSNAVKSLNDHDMLHMQLVSPGLSTSPEHVKVTIKAEDAQLDTTNTRLWGFGFYGYSELENGVAVFESGERFRRESSVIALLRFNKGIFASESIQDRDFSEVLEQAFKGADFGDDEDGDDTVAAILAILFSFLFVVGFPIWLNRYLIKGILGVKRVKDVDWSRDIPYDGDLLASNYLMNKLGEVKKGNALASSIILKMIYKGQLEANISDAGKVEISFTDRNLDSLDNVERGLYTMMVLASGSDRILQDREFSRWSSKHVEHVNNWVSKAYAVGCNNLRQKGFIKGNNFVSEPKAQQAARACVGFRKYLSDFTLSKEREVKEVALWQDYLVFGALFGIADRVAQQLKDINPQFFDEQAAYDYTTMRQVLYMSDNLARSITNAQQKAAAASSGKGGFGGSTSFGGGGGFSGGGFGGGSR